MINKAPWENDYNGDYGINSPQQVLKATLEIYWQLCKIGTTCKWFDLVTKSKPLKYFSI